MNTTRIEFAPGHEDEAESFVRRLLWDAHPECCGCPTEGGYYMGMSEQICCGQPTYDTLNDAQIVASLRERFPESREAPEQDVAAKLRLMKLAPQMLDMLRELLTTREAEAKATLTWENATAELQRRQAGRAGTRDRHGPRIRSGKEGSRPHRRSRGPLTSGAIMNRHFQAYAALPCAPLGAPKQPAQQPPTDGEWQPLRPGYEHRTLAGGATEVRVTPGSLATAAPAKAQPREPAYRPEGFGYAHVDHRGHQGDVIPQQSAPDPGRVTPEDVHGNESGITPLAPSEPSEEFRLVNGIPVGATHTHENSPDAFYREIPGDPEDRYYAWAPFFRRDSWGAPLKCSGGGPNTGAGFRRITTAPTEWQSGPPPSVGWWLCADCERQVASESRRIYWDGTKITHYTAAGEAGAIPLSTMFLAPMFWRAPTTQWPEPQQ